MPEAGSEYRVDYESAQCDSRAERWYLHFTIIVVDPRSLSGYTLFRSPQPLENVISIKLKENTAFRLKEVFLNYLS